MNDVEKTPARLEHEKYQQERAGMWLARIQNLNGRPNAGFKVIAVVPREAPHLAYVLAEDEERGNFVTWLFNADSDGFGLGHYFESRSNAKMTQDELREKAYTDLRERAGLD